MRVSAPPLPKTSRLYAGLQTILKVTARFRGTNPSIWRGGGSRVPPGACVSPPSTKNILDLRGLTDYSQVDGPIPWYKSVNLAWWRVEGPTRCACQAPQRPLRPQTSVVPILRCGGNITTHIGCDQHRTTAKWITPGGASSISTSASKNMV